MQTPARLVVDRLDPGVSIQQTGHLEVPVGETERIEKEIEQARTELAATLDQLAERANPQRLADDAKNKAVAFVSQPAVKYSLMGAGALALALVIRKIVS